MDFSKYSSMLYKYFEEAIEIKDSYENAKQRVMDENEVRIMVFNDVKDRYRKTEEAFKAGKVEEEVYIKAKKDYEIASSISHDMENQLKAIEIYQQHRLKKVLENLIDLKQKYIEEIDNEKEKLKYQLIKAKHDFLTQAIKVRKAFKELSKNEMELQELTQELGLETGIEVKDAFQVLSSAIMDDAGAVVTKEELYAALHSGKISKALKKELVKAANIGI